MTSLPHRFSLLQRLLHWLMAACIIAMLFIGVGMVSTVTPKYLPLIALHKTLGVTLFVLVLVRLALRLYYGVPPLPADLPAPVKLGARLSHLALYGLMIVMPLLGLAMLWAADYPVVLYGGIQIPPLLPQSDSLHTLLWNFHFYLGFAFFALVLLHVGAGLFHALIRRDGVFGTMAPLLLTDRVTPAERDRRRPTCVQTGKTGRARTARTS
ncbi:MAG: cytochrome B [Proteobacteria bacterium]|nr:MAG: cytochrome B [Pseudomonadota bacterium]